MSLAVPTLALSSLTSSILQAMGDVKKPMWAMAVGAAAKVFFNFILCGRAEINIYGAAISTVICYGITCAVNLAALCKKRQISLSLGKIFTFPTLSGILPTLLAGAIYGYIGKCGGIISLIITIISSVLLWIMCIMLFKVVKVADIKRLFDQKSITFFSKNH